MVRLRPRGERTSHRRGRGRRDPPSRDRWPLGKAALRSSRGIAIMLLGFAFRSAPDSRGLRQLALARSSGPVAKRRPVICCTLAVWRDLVDNLSANGALSPDDIPEFPEQLRRWIVSLGVPDGRFGAREGGADPAAVGAASGASGATHRGRGWEEFGPWICGQRGRNRLPASSPQSRPCDARSNHCSRRTGFGLARLGLMWPTSAAAGLQP